MKVTIHHNPGAEWQVKRLPAFVEGMRCLGHEVTTTRSNRRVSPDPAILFGTSSFRQVERERGDWLLVDRASVGDPEYVSLVWNGHGQMGDHFVPDDYDESRWERLGIELKPIRPKGQCHVICGQAEPFTDRYQIMSEWYDSIEYATHFRPHPTGSIACNLPVKKDFEDIAVFHVLTSSVGVEAVIEGVNVKAHDPVSMAYGIEDREQWAHWLAWTQWSWDEIAAGQPIGHLFEWLKSRGQKNSLDNSLR